MKNDADKTDRKQIYNNCFESLQVQQLTITD